MNASDPLDTPVLIVGAGLAGLSTAAFLGLHGVRCTVLDRHLSTSDQPKARGQMPSIMEAFEVAGIADDIRAAAPSGRPEMTVAICESVAGRVIHSFSERLPDFGAFSPAMSGMASQSRAEAALAAHAVRSGTDLRFATRLESFKQDVDGVRAVVRDLKTRAERVLTAGYLVAADGHRGAIAAQLGIGVRSRGAFDPTCTVRFRADLDGVVADSAVLMYYVQNPALPTGSGVLVSTDTPGEYVAGMLPDPQRSDEQTVELIRMITGVPELQVQLLGSAIWDIAHRVVDRMSVGRVHLVGDAAHLMPPTGGQGGNTAMLDGLHLAWKLAAVVTGQAGPALLDSHHTEQLPYGEAVADWQYANMFARLRPAAVEKNPAPPVDPMGLMFGYRAPSGAFVAEPGDDVRFEDPAAPSGRPGTRAPHVWLERDGRPVSTRQLLFRGFVLLTGDPAWAAAADKAGAALGIRLDPCVIGADLADPEDAWSRAYRVSAQGAVLVRPDGVIGWRSSGRCDPTALDGALRTVLSR